MKTIFLTRRNASSATAGVCLEPSAAITLTRGKGLLVRCNGGLLWMTVEGDAADYWLKPGEEAQIRYPGRVIIEAVQKTKLQICPPPLRRLNDEQHPAMRF